MISTQAEAERLLKEQAEAEAKKSDEADRLAAEAAKAKASSDEAAKEAEEKADEAEEAVEREGDGQGVLPTARTIGLGAVEQSDAVHKSNCRGASPPRHRSTPAHCLICAGSEVCSARYNAHGRHLLLHMPAPKLIRWRIRVPRRRKQCINQIDAARLPPC